MPAGLSAIAAGGLQLEKLAPATQAKFGLKPEFIALKVKHAGQCGKHAAAKYVGFLQVYIVVAVNGLSQAMREGVAIGHLPTEQRMGDSVKWTILRGGERRQISLRLQ